MKNATFVLTLTSSGGFFSQLRFTVLNDTTVRIREIFRDGGPNACIPSFDEIRVVSRNEARDIWSEHASDGYIRS